MIPHLNADDRRHRWAALIALGLLALVVRLIPGSRIIDDAYITYRYAKNLVDGIGFVYNPGENVLGTTTPLYTLLLALIGWIGRSDAYPIFSPVVNAVADSIGVPLLYLLGRRVFHDGLPALVLALLWAIAPRSVTFAIGGMETSPFIALMLGALTAYLDRRFNLCSALAALATLTRPDALVWVGPLGVAILIDQWVSRQDRRFIQRLPWREGAIFAAVLAPWVIFAAATFGSPLPHSIAAKSVAYHLPPTQGLVVFVQQYATPFHDDVSLGPTGAMVGAVVYTVIAALGGLYLAYDDRRNLLIAIIPWVYALVFAAANPLIFRWYVTPPMVMYVVCMIGGVWGLARRFVSTRSARWILAALGLVWMGFSLRAWELHPDHGPDRPAPQMAWIDLEILYQKAGESLAPLAGPETVIAAGDIGAVGWYSKAHILDALGLISPEASDYYPIDPSMLADAPYAVAPDLILDRKPDYVVILETYGRNGLLKDPRFGRLYRLRKMLDTDIYGSRGMLIFERVDQSGGN